MRILLIILLLPFYYFSFWLLITGIIGAIRMLQSKNWILTKGEITDSEILFKKSGGIDEPVRYKFVNKHTYSYTVNSQHYKSNQTLASDFLYQKQFKSISKFPKKYASYKKSLNYLNAEKRHHNSIGKKVAVYYNPNKPEIACLENRFEKLIILPILMAPILFLTLIFWTNLILTHY